MATKATRDVIDIAIRPELDMHITGGSIDGSPIGVNSPNLGYFTNLQCINLTVNGSSNVSANSGNPTGPAGGDLGGTYPNPNVVNVHLGSPLALIYGGTANTTGRPSGAAGGDLRGTYPNPILATVNSNVGTFTNVTMTVNPKGLVTAVSSGTPVAGSLNRRIVTSGSGTFTIPVGTVLVKVLGGGGGGSNSPPLSPPAPPPPPPPPPPPVSCFPAGSFVLMSDLTWKEITNIEVGDEVWSPMGTAKIRENYKTILGPRPYFTMDDFSIRWSAEHSFWVNRGKQWIWSLRKDLLVEEVKQGVIGGLKDMDSIFEGLENQPEHFAHLSGWNERVPNRIENEEYEDMPLYLPITENGEMIIVNGYLVGAALDESKFDYNIIDWKQVENVPPIPRVPILHMKLGKVGVAGPASSGSGGGAGGYLEKILTGLTVGKTLNYAVGSGGSVGNSGGASSVSSGSQSISSLLANPGGGATASSVGAGGTASGGDFNIQGQAGGAYVTLSNSYVGNGGTPGGGLGEGGASPGTPSGAANNGSGFGRGGSGGVVGGNGQGGIIIFEWLA